MKRTGIKRLTYAEAIEKQNEARDRARAKYLIKQKEPKVKKTKVKNKPDRVKTLKAKVWAMFSKYIRKSYADNNGMVMTCDGQFLYWQDTHCGHLLNNSERSQGLGGNALWYDERNFAPQSANGNYFNANDSAKTYMLWAVKKHGSDVIDELYRLKHTPRKFTEDELEEKYLYYKHKFDTL